EAVMAAVRMARFNTRRKLIVCFAGAYHGWWDGVQPGLGSERSIDDCLTLKDLHEASLEAIRRRAGEIAGVLVNPVQSFHPNAPPPSDAILLTSGVRRTEDPSARYAERPMRIAYVVGTFSAHPVVMGAMNEFLRWVVEPSTAQLYTEMNERCAQWVQATNRRLLDAALPVRVVHLGTVWTVLFSEPGR